jgi:hypothetical protein
MAYSDISLLAVDWDFINRVTACAATEQVDEAPRWAQTHSWEMAALPGFGDKYASAIANGIERPGWDPAVISDNDILSGVQALNTPA